MRKFLQALDFTNETITSITYLFAVRLRPTYFSKEGKMGFINLITFMLNFTKKSLQLELDNFFKITQGSDCRISKQAFSEARQKVSPKAFTILFDGITKQFYELNDFKTFHGYRLSAIDGSTLELQNTAELREAYGYAENSSQQKVARARVSGLYDVENKLMIDAVIGRYDMDELNFAYQHIEKLQEIGLQNDLILFDRGYPSKELIARLTKANINFLMRASSYFIKEVNHVKGPDETVEFIYKKQKYPVRVIKLMLESGVQEILVTSLLDSHFGIEDFKALYFKRWGIETKFDELKHRLQLENFTGEKPIAVEQDFYASMYLSNMAALAKMDADEQIRVNNEDQDLKYEYQANTNILIGKLKDRLILMVLEPNARKRTSIVKHVMKEIVRNVIPIRPGRTNPRIKKKTPDRYPMNQKACL